MKNLAVEILSQTASFRNPDFQNFQKSLNLPPPTTVVGLSGAAMGLSPSKVQEFFELNDLRIGVYGLFAGKCSDTWKYNKEIRDMRTYDPAKDGSIVQKEYLVRARFIIAFSSERDHAIEHLCNAFEDPAYALTMGNSDCLAFVKNIQSDLPQLTSYEVENCMVEGHVLDNVITQFPHNLDFSIYDTTDSFTYDLPVKFNYASDYGKRTVARIATYSIIGRKMKLNYSIDGLSYNDAFIPILNL